MLEVREVGKMAKSNQGLDASELMVVLDKEKNLRSDASRRLNEMRSKLESMKKAMIKAKSRADLVVKKG